MYQKISKARARKLWAEGKVFYICPRNMAPGNVWGMCAMVTGVEDTSFDSYINAFVYYNCTRETGRYPAYYVKA